MGIKQRGGDYACIDKKDLKVLPGGMEYLDHVGIAEQLIDRLQRQPFDQRVDDGPGAVILARIGQLQQAQFGIIGPLAQKFGIDGDIGVLCRFGTKGSEGFRRRNDIHADPFQTRDWPKAVRI